MMKFFCNALLPILAAAGIFFSAGIAAALPTLQLDIGQGVYDPASETVVASSSRFVLYALLTTTDESLLNDVYYISAAVIPQVDVNSDLGFFSFDGQTVAVTGDMTYGNPPLHDFDGGVRDSQDLSSHGVFDTYFTEFDFTFDPALNVAGYNVQDDPGGFDPLTGGTTYYREFSVDLSRLAEGFGIHFDLYDSYIQQTRRSGQDVEVGLFAPFSHDAEGSRIPPVPEPGTLVLLACGLGGCAWARRRKIGC